MYNMVWNISIGKYLLAMLDSVEITRSVEALSDTAIIILPGTAYNKALDIESKINVGDKVKIELGYDDKPVTEFEGYLQSIATDDGSIKLNCEDALFLFKKSLKNSEKVNISVKSLLEQLIKELNLPYSISCDYDFSYDKFVINNATGYDVLKKIQEEAKPNIYLKSGVLHIHPQYSEIFGTSIYDFGKNIEKSELVYKKEEDRKYLVTVESTDNTGKVIKVEAGSTGGESLNLKISGVSNETSLRKMAEEALKMRSYTGYEGSFKTWLVPYCDAGYKATIIDSDYEYKNGSYYVIEVKTVFSKSGGERTIKIGKKISE